ncbi:molybdopterin-dependent oxidoreductase [Skermanella stibiiresistens]|uniref:molybdopterin-dependent oxidoreductase n=1 Tax=Skermanella stibiiresistens TaxID=913326 RepID=UPI0018DC8663|nr:molybdopterin-dependent oxidoreductase [Skermanella stibiiresistens]
MYKILRSTFFLAVFSLVVPYLTMVSRDALAGTLAAPAGPVVLTVTGKIDNTNAPSAAQFDLAMLEALPGRVARVTTPWAEGVNDFKGPLTRALLEAVGARGTKLKVTALNDYSAEVPFEDFMKFDVILAVKKNDAYLPVRNQGPIFVIYPFDTTPNLYNEVYFGRSVWQVKSIEVQ